MHKNTQSACAQAFYEDLAALSEDAKALIAATASVTGEKIKEARERLSAALERSKDLFAQQAASSAETADKAIRENPYQALAVGAGLGLLLGLILARR